MEFLTFECIGLVFIAFLLFYIKKNAVWQKIVLLAASMVFIAYYHVMYLAVALGIALFTYAVGRLLAKYKDSKAASWILGAGIVMLAGGWLAFRYWSPLFPLGISFYTFQALSYLIEVYWDDEQVEDNVVDFVLYMILFMKFLSGPIERGFDFLPQLKKAHSLNYRTITDGFKTGMTGVMMKVVIADRLAPHLNVIFASVHNASGVQLLEATMLYPLQLYADFAGYTLMAIGIGMMFGFHLSPNFDRPFISMTTSELWRRWHISLSFWVRDYVFVPLTASTRAWKQWGVYFSLVVTFVVLGVWHGAGWTFAIYGLIQGIIIIYETAARKQREYVQHRVNKTLYFILSILRTYILFALSLLFFRIDKLSDVWYTLGHLFAGVNSTWNETGLGMTDKDWFVLLGATIVLFVYEYFNAKRNLFDEFRKCPVVMRWCIYYLLLFLLFVFGCFGVEDFIYIQF
jgi:alginate O-acetyltransferase complex protein AlgI